MRRSDNSLAAVLLVGRLVDAEVAPFKASEYRNLCSQLGEPASLLGQTATELESRGAEPSLSERIARLLERAVPVAFELDRYQDAGIWTITEHDDSYPEHLRQRLGSKAPVLLHGSGSPEILGQAGIGVVGSRAVSEEGAEVAREAAGHAAALGVPLVSGGARGVDQIAMNAAHQAGGSVVAVLADALAKTIVRTDVREALLDGNTAMCTPYGPEAGFSVGNAMGRNKIIYGLAAVTMVVASDFESGGTWAGATEALRHNFGRLVVWNARGEGPGNASLIERGGVAITEVGELDAILQQPEEPREEPPEVVQDPLFPGRSP